MNNNSEKIKIALVYDAIYPFIKGGTEIRNFEISKRLANMEYEVHIFGMKWWNGENIINKDGVFIHGICKPMPLYTKSGIRSIWQAIYFGINCFKLIKEDFNFVDINHMPFFSLFSTKIVCLLKRKKMYATWNEVWGRKYWVEYMGISGNIAYLIEWLSARLPDHIIAVSEHTKSKLVNDLGVRRTTISVVNNGIDLEQIKKVKPSKEKSDIIYAGRLLSHKNVDVLIKSMGLLKKSYPNIKAIIVGEGPEEINLKQITKNLRLEKNVVFYDFLDKHDDLYSLFKSSSVFVLPSTREGFGMVALEASACNLPVITTNNENNATQSLIKNGVNGKIISINPNNIANNIIKYLQPEKKGKINNISQYEWQNITKQIKNIYLI